MEATAFKIEKNVPAPTKRGRTSDFPFAQMNTGDSFVVPASDAMRLQAATSYQHKVSERRFSVRREGENYRCWRMS